MRTSRTFQLQTIVLLYLTTFAAAWPIMHWPRWMPELDSLVVRADSSSAATATPAATTSAASKTASATETNSDSSATATGSGSTSKATASGSSSTKASASTTKTYTTSYDAADPAGGVSLITPAVASGSQYYKIGDFVTFAWNYTSLSATPTAVNILASCSANAQTYTIAANHSVGANATQEVVWDTGSYQATAVQNPLLTQTYTLVIYDAAQAVTAAAQAGYLAAYDTYSFGMYSPQAYTPLASGFSCATCSGALSAMERRAMGLVLGMGALAVGSAAWFVGGTGVIW